MAADLRLDETDDGVVLPVRAQPRARKNAVTGLHDGCLKVAVTAVPERGKANDAILTLLAGSLDLRRAQLQLVSGASSSRKRILVRDLTPSELRQRIEIALGEGSSE
jgi:hypothetical protein